MTSASNNAQQTITGTQKIKSKWETVEKQSAQFVEAPLAQL